MLSPYSLNPTDYRAFLAFKSLVIDKKSSLTEDNQLLRDFVCRDHGF